MGCGSSAQPQVVTEEGKATTSESPAENSTAQKSEPAQDSTKPPPAAPVEPPKSQPHAQPAKGSAPQTTEDDEKEEQYAQPPLSPGKQQIIEKWISSLTPPPPVEDEELHRSPRRRDSESESIRTHTRDGQAGGDGSNSLTMDNVKHHTHMMAKDAKQSHSPTREAQPHSREASRLTAHGAGTRQSSATGVRASGGVDGSRLSTTVNAEAAVSTNVSLTNSHSQLGEPDSKTGSFTSPRQRVRGSPAAPSNRDEGTPVKQEANTAALATNAPAQPPTQNSPFGNTQPAPPPVDVPVDVPTTDPPPPRIDDATPQL
eukprot:NODE_2590_length_1030_cov_54.971207_g2571_i0.p1 GENE.NODE_2590_length_1030_cov_54.971207_g2571_i0~~NODE_2590_length_1030_cov_54.971207_g2571_i0.p1  ORF type:complete len:315 (+),score=27.46 NODE_2590_length_1030_cov_54.971207_g2571_i0:78-1022(+)